MTVSTTDDPDVQLASTLAALDVPPDFAEYERTIEDLLPALDAGNHAAAVELAALPGAVRGFGHVKERHVEHAARRRAELLATIQGAGQPRQRGDGGVKQNRSRVVMAG